MSFPSHKAATQVISSIYICPRLLLIHPVVRAVFQASNQPLHAAAQSSQLPSSPFPDPTLLLLQPRPTSCSFLKLCSLPVPSAWNPLPTPPATQLPLVHQALASSFLPQGGRSGPWVGSWALSLQSLPPSLQHCIIRSVCLLLCLSRDSELLKGSSVSFMATAKHRPHLESAANSYLSHWATQEQGPRPGVPLIASAQAAPFSPHSISQQGPLTRPPGTWHR